MPSNIRKKTDLAPIPLRDSVRRTRESTQTGKQGAPIVNLCIKEPDGISVLKSFEGLPIVIGRGQETDIVLKDKNVSRVHAEIHAIGEQLFVRDLDSLNGTRLNGEVIVDASFQRGDIVEVGDCEIRLLDEIPEDRDYIDEEQMDLSGNASGGVLEIIRSLDIEKIIDQNVVSMVPRSKGSPLEKEQLRESVERLNQASSNLIVIMNLISSIGTYSHPNQVCDQFATALRTVFPHVENMAVVEYESDSTRPMSILYVDTDESDFQPADGPSKTVIRKVVDEVRAVYAVDAKKDPRFHASDSIANRGVRSMMCSPIIVRGEVRGAMYVENLSNPYCFSQFDLNFLTVFAFHLGTALETSRAFAERDRAFEKAVETVKLAKQDKSALLLQYSQSERKFRALFEQSALGAAVINLMNGEIEEVNDGLVRMLGHTRRRLSRMTYAELLASPSRDDAQDWLKYVRGHGEGSCKTQLLSKSGEKIIALQSCRSLRMGESAVMVAYFIDITAKERAESQIKTQLLRVTALSELSQAYMKTMDRENIYQLLFDKVITVLPVDSFIFFQRDTISQELQLVFHKVRSSETEFEGSGEVDEAFLTNLKRKLEAVIESGRPYVDHGDATMLKVEQGATVDRSFAVVPMSTHQEVEGVVCVGSSDAQAYDSSHVETLLALVAQTSLALSNARAFDSLHDQQEKLRQLNLQIMNAQEVERKRISRELHDGVGQQLTAMKYTLESIQKAAKSQDGKKLLDRIDEARDLASQIIDDLRSISLDLRPTMLDDLGLRPTLEWLVRQYKNRYEIEIGFEVELGEDPIDADVSTAAFRIVQEALGNVAKHAQAEEIHLSVTVEENDLIIDVLDNGVGFDSEDLSRMQTERGCSGMLNMRERARFLKGTFQLDTKPGEGTKLRITIPIKEN